MVVFTPPIGEHLVVPLSSSALSSYIRSIDIQFRARDVDRKLQPGDRVEVWTDAPDQEGKRVEGGWRAVTFEGEIDGVGKGDGTAIDSGLEEDVRVVQLPAFALPVHPSRTDSGPSDLQSDTTNNLVARISLPYPHSISNLDLDFEYTFRIVYPDGKMWWLGGLGANGTVKFQLGGGEDGTKVDIWNGWKGWGVLQDGTTTTIPRPSSDQPSQTDGDSGRRFSLALLHQEDPHSINTEFQTFSPLKAGSKQGQARGLVLLLPKTQGQTYDITRTGEGEYRMVPLSQIGTSSSQDDVSPYRVHTSQGTIRGQEGLVFELVRRDGNEELSSGSGPGKVYVFSRMPTGTEVEGKVHRVRVDLASLDIEQGKDQGGKTALWDGDSGRSVVLPRSTSISENKTEILLELTQEEESLTALSIMERVVLQPFGNIHADDNKGAARPGFLGCVEPVSGMEWVPSVEREEEEDFEEVVLVPFDQDDDDNNEDGADSKANGLFAPSQDGSTWATLGSSDRSMPRSRSASASVSADVGEGGVKGRMEEEGLMSPRTVDLHEVEDDHEEVDVDEVGVGKDDHVSASRADTADNNHPDTDTDESETSTLDKAQPAPAASDDPDADQDLPVVRRNPEPDFKPFSWIAIMLRNLWMRTLGGFFRWIVVRFRGNQIEREGDGGAGARITEPDEVDEETPLLGKTRSAGSSDHEEEEQEEVVPTPVPRADDETHTEEQQSVSLLDLPEAPPMDTPAVPPQDIAPIQPAQPPVYKVITRTRTRMFKEPGYMKLVSGKTGRITLLTDLEVTLRIIHRTGAAGGLCEDVKLDFQVVRADAKEGRALTVVKVDTAGLPDPFELRISQDGDVAA